MAGHTNAPGAGKGKASPTPPACARLSVIGIAFAAMAASASAEPLPFATYADDVDATVTRLVGEIELFRFTDAHLAMIKSLAYQEGVAVICPAFKTDEDKLTNYLSQIVPMRDEDVRAAPLADVVMRSEVMFAFGTHFGATVATGKADPPAFCARAETVRQDPTMVARTWLPTD